MSSTSSTDRVHLWRLPQFNNIELLHARYSSQSFRRHTHEQFALGMIEAGALEFDYRGQTLLAPAGCVNLCIAGEAHTGHAANNEGWTYRMFYFDPALLQQAAMEINADNTEMPFFKSGVLRDEILAAQIRRLHIDLEGGDLPALERDYLLEQILSRLIRQHAQHPPTLARQGSESTVVAQVCDYLKAHYRDEINSSDLSRVAHLSRFHLNRVFTQTAGIPPYAYLRQVRLQQAKQLIEQGESIAAAATQSGFNDQSHLTRWFKRLYGFTPGEYSNSVQYS
jgi:AraC-like DNA-binding protein